MTACEDGVGREVEKIKNIISDLLTNIFPASYCHPSHLAIVCLAKQNLLKILTATQPLRMRLQRGEEEGESNLNDMSTTSQKSL